MPVSMKSLRFACAAALLGLAGAATASVSGVVISQVYGGNGNIYARDFVELLNTGAAAVSISGWSVQYSSATGTGNFSGNGVTGLSGTLQPGQYFLVQLASAAAGAALPAADATGTTNLSGTAGKVILANVNSGLACNGGSTPCNATQLAQIVDLVGYGTANFFEGAVAPAATATTALLRNVGGCTDTDNNASDFASGAPAPRNSASAGNLCGGGVVNAPIVPSCPAVSLVQGSGGSAPFSASDTDSVVNSATILSGVVAGITLGNVTPASGDGGTLGGQVLVDASVPTGTYNLQLGFGNSEAQLAQCTLMLSVGAASVPTPIYDIQGSGNTSPLVGQSVTTRGVVTKLLGNGYFMQDPVGDGNPFTSDGIFVFTSTAPTVLVGQHIQVTGTVDEFNTVTELTGTSSLQVLASGVVVAPVPLNLPEMMNGELERFEGMLVRIETPMTVSQNFFQGRFGQVTLSAGGRLLKPTNIYPAGSTAAIALAAENARRVLILDDGSSAQNPNPIPYIGAGNTLRAGDSVDNLVGVIDHGLITSSTSVNAPRDYKLHPTEAPVFVRDNPRTAAPDMVGGNVRVASFNVLNYFTTFTNGQTASGQSGQGCALGDAVAASNCRGADNAAEFARQRSKIVAAMVAIGADVFGLMEIQNNGSVALQNLVDGMNTQVGAPTWAVVPPPTGGVGTDAIQVAMVYKPGKLALVGAALGDPDAVNNRAPVAQTFAAANGEKFSVVVNHMKSKSCSGATGADLDQNDGQGCFNARRMAQAQRLVDYFISLVKIAAADDDVLVIGDLNSYGKEDPILLLADADLVDQLALRVANPYSYVFDGEAGYLDHALSSISLSAQVSGVTEWHINADEPSVIDYNTEFKPQDLFTASPYRASDHDPVVVGLNLLKKLIGTAGRDVLLGTAGDDVITGGEGGDTLTGGAGRDVFLYQSTRDAGDTITDFSPGQDRIDLHGLLASIGYTGSDPVADSFVRLVAGAGGVSLQVDTDGPAGVAAFRPLLLLRGVSLPSLLPSRDFIY